MMNIFWIGFGWQICVSLSERVVILGNSFKWDKFQGLIKEKLAVREKRIYWTKETLLLILHPISLESSSSRKWFQVRIYLNSFMLVCKGRSQFLLRKNQLKKERLEPKKITIEKELLLEQIPELYREIEGLKNELYEKGLKSISGKMTLIFSRVCMKKELLIVMEIL